MVPQIVFFTELDADTLATLLAQPGLLDALAAQGYGVTMALLDLSAGRAAIVRSLTGWGVPVTARLLLPPDAGADVRVTLEGNELPARVTTTRASRYVEATGAGTGTISVRW